MTPRGLALGLGLIYLLLGVTGLIRTGPALAVAHLALGAWGLAAYTGRAAALSYARAAAFILAALGLAGLLEGTPQLLHGPIVWLHLASAGLAGFVAWRPHSGERRGLAGDRRRGRGAPPMAERRSGLEDRRSFIEG